jgi:hypothetical protein
MIPHGFYKKARNNNIQFYALGFLHGFAYKASKKKSQEKH